MDCFAEPVIRRRFAPTGWNRNDGNSAAQPPPLRHHQHVEHDDRRQRQDHRPDADGPHDVLGGKALLRNLVIAFEVHDAPPRFLLLLLILIRGRL